MNPSDHTEVVGLIDWQSTEVAPLYSQGRQPHILNYEGPEVYGLERPRLPENIEELDAAAKGHAVTLFLNQSLCVLFNTLAHKQNAKLFAALEFQRTDDFLLLLLAHNLLVDGEASYLSQVAELKARWDAPPRARNLAYPFDFSAKQLEEFEADAENSRHGMELMSGIRYSIGKLFPEQGITRPDQYEETLDALEQMKDQIIQQYTSNEEEREQWRKVWPFGT